MRRHAPLPRRASAGFTLVEVLIALTVLIAVSLALVQSFSYSIETKNRVTAVNERYHEGRQVMVRVARELRMAFLREELPEQLREEKPMMITRFEGDDDKIHFATTAHLRLHAGTRESDQAEVAYYLGATDRNSPYRRGKTLFRRESKRIDDDPERGGSIWPVVDGVLDFKLEYWDSDKEIGDDAWQNNWDSHENAESPVLPSRVRITLELAPPEEDGPPIRFVTQAAIQVRRPLSPLRNP